MSGWRYITRDWQSEAGDGWQERPSLTVFDANDMPVNTGLLDAFGVPLYRLPDRQPIGFCLDRPRHQVKARSIKP